MSRFAEISESGYYAVIFTNQLRDAGSPDYSTVATRMAELAKGHSGYLGMETTRDASGFGITISYWQNLEAVEAWRNNAEHLVAQERGKREWYERFALKIARVERASFGPDDARP